MERGKAPSPSPLVLSVQKAVWWAGGQWRLYMYRRNDMQPLPLSRIPQRPSYVAVMLHGAARSRWQPLKTLGIFCNTRDMKSVTFGDCGREYC